MGRLLSDYSCIFCFRGKNMEYNDLFFFYNGKQADAWEFFLQRKKRKEEKRKGDGKDRMQGLEC